MTAQVKRVATKQLSALILILIVALASASVLLLQNATGESGKKTAPVHVGVSFQGNTTAEAKLLIDRIKDYTNLFVLGFSPVSRQEETTTEVCDYAFAAGMDIIVNFGYYDRIASGE